MASIDLQSGIFPVFSPVQEDGDTYGKPRKVIWVWVFLVVVSIYSLIPLARRLERWIDTFAEKAIFFQGSIAFFVLTIPGYLLWRKWKLGRAWSGQDGWALAIIALVVGLIWKHREIPVEGVHVVQYFSLAVVSFLAMSRSLTPGLVYLSAFSFCVSVAFGDELLQWMTPKRHGQWGDVSLDAMASFLGLVFVHRVLRPESVNRSASRSGLGLMMMVVAGLVMVSSLFFSATPRNVSKWRDHLTWVDAWAEKERTFRAGTIDYGYVIKVEGVGEMMSRAKGLDHYDALDKRLVLAPGSKLMEIKKGDFVWEDPANYESRIRIFSRNRNFEKANEPGAKPRDVERFMENAWVEQRFLEATLPVAMKNGAVEELKMPAGMAATAPPAEGENARSRVSRNLFCRFPKENLYALIGLYTLGCVTLIGRFWPK